MPVPLPNQRIGHFMRFHALPSALPARAVFALAWRFTDQGLESWTSRLNQFKKADEAAVRGGCSVAREAVSGFKVNRPPAVVVCAIPSGERVLPRNHPVARLGEAVADGLGIDFCPDIVEKRPHRALHTIENGSARDAEVMNQYTCHLSDHEGTVIVVDDFVTRGATVGEVGRAIREKNPEARVVGMVLGKTERYAYARGFGHDLRNDHLPSSLAEIWDGG